MAFRLFNALTHFNSAYYDENNQIIGGLGQTLFPRDNIGSKTNNLNDIGDSSNRHRDIYCQRLRTDTVDLSGWQKRAILGSHTYSVHDSTNPIAETTPTNSYLYALTLNTNDTILTKRCREMYMMVLMSDSSGDITMGTGEDLDDLSTVNDIFGYLGGSFTVTGSTNFRYAVIPCYYLANATVGNAVTTSKGLLDLHAEKMYFGIRRSSGTDNYRFIFYVDEAFKFRYNFDENVGLTIGANVLTNAIATGLVQNPVEQHTFSRTLYNASNVKQNSNPTVNFKRVRFFGID